MRLLFVSLCLVAAVTSTVRWNEPGSAHLNWLLPGFKSAHPVICTVDSHCEPGQKCIAQRCLRIKPSEKSAAASGMPPCHVFGCPPGYQCRQNICQAKPFWSGEDASYD